MSRSARRRSAQPIARARQARRRHCIGMLTRRDGSGLIASRSYEALKPGQTFVKLAKGSAMPFVVHPDPLEQRRFEVLERPEVIAVGRRDLGDHSSRFARPGVDAAQPYA